MKNFYLVFAIIGLMLGFSMSASAQKTDKTKTKSPRAVTQRQNNSVRSGNQGNIVQLPNRTTTRAVGGAVTDKWLNAGCPDDFRVPPRILSKRPN